MTSSRVGTRDAGAAAVEYALLVALVAGAVVTAVATLGDGVEESFERTCRAFGGGSGHVPTPAGGGGGLEHAPGLHRPRC